MFRSSRTDVGCCVRSMLRTGCFTRASSVTWHSPFHSWRTWPWFGVRCSVTPAVYRILIIFRLEFWASFLYPDTTNHFTVVVPAIPWHLRKQVRPRTIVIIFRLEFSTIFIAWHYSSCLTNSISLPHNHIHHTHHALILAAHFCRLLLRYFRDVTLAHYSLSLSFAR